MEAHHVQTGPADECAKHGKAAMYYRKGSEGHGVHGRWVIELESWICYACILETIERLKTENP